MSGGAGKRSSAAGVPPLLAEEDAFPRAVGAAAAAGSMGTSVFLADLTDDFRKELVGEAAAATLAPAGGGGLGVRFLPSALALRGGLVPLAPLRHLGLLVDRLCPVQFLLLGTAAVLVCDAKRILSAAGGSGGGARDVASQRACRVWHLLGRRQPNGAALGSCFPAQGVDYDRLEVTRSHVPGH